MVYGSGLENQRVFTGTVGSNPTLSVLIQQNEDPPDLSFPIKECCVADGDASPERFDHVDTLTDKSVRGATQPDFLRNKWI